MNIKIHFQCKVHMYMDAQILGTCSLWQQNFVWWYLIISAFPLPTKLRISAMGWAQSATLQSDSQVTPEMWVLSVELALGHLASTYNM